MKYYIGVDGGGTKTAICAAAADSSILHSKQTGGASWREHGAKSVIKNIKDVINSFPIDANDEVAGIALGMPCFGESEDGDSDLEKAIQEAFPETPYYLTNDVEVGWAGSLSLSSGVNVVAGTGSIAFGKNESGETARSGGWSEFFSDEGSCYWIGRKLLQIFSKQADGRTPKDELYNIVRRAFNIKNDFEAIDLIHSQYMPNRDKVASLQLLARDAALAGSESMIALYKKAISELCSMVVAIRDKLQFEKQPFLVSYSGGLFKTGDLVLPHFFTGIEAIGGKPVTPNFEPVYGALLLAFEHYNPENLPTLYNRLEKIENQ